MSEMLKRHYGPWTIEALRDRGIVADNECWEWLGYRRNGYGRARDGGRFIGVHRIAWRLAHGDPGAMDVLHRCDNPPCFNPSHLFLGTDADNTLDKMAKGRHRGSPGEANPSASLRDRDVLAIRAMYRTGRFTQVGIANLFDVSQGTVSHIILGNGWKCVREHQ